jgi:hypothetical protein
MCFGSSLADMKTRVLNIAALLQGYPSVDYKGRRNCPCKGHAPPVRAENCHLCGTDLHHFRLNYSNKI